MLGPLPRSVPSVHLLGSSPRASASPNRAEVRHARRPPYCNFNDGEIPGLQPFHHVQAPTLARPPGCSHRWSSESPGQPGRLHHAYLGWLPAPSCGIATCLTRATDTAGLSPAGLRPCRPLRPAVPHLHRYYGFVRLLPSRPGRLRSPLVTRYLCRGMLASLPEWRIPATPSLAGLCRACRARLSPRRWGALLGSWGAPVETCPGLGTPAAPDDLALSVTRVLPSASLTASASATTTAFGAEFLTARFLTVYASHPPVAR